VIPSRDPNGPGWLFTKSAERRKLCLDFIKTWTYALEQAFASLGRRDAACGAGEKPEAKARLEGANCLTER
jgi:hypothetical protein